MVGDENWIHCLHCGHPTSHAEVFKKSVIDDAYVEYDDDDIDDSDDRTPNHIWGTDYRVLQCQRCRTMAFEKNDWAVHPQYSHKDPQIFPPRSAGLAAQKASTQEYLPPDIWRIYHETLKAVDADAPILATAGMRMLIEAVAAHENIRGKNIVEKIQALGASGVLSSRSSAILHMHRQFGNRAVHELTPPQRADLLVLLDILGEILSSTYRLPAVAKELENRTNPDSDYSTR